MVDHHNLKRTRRGPKAENLSISNSDLVDLLNEPREELDIEHKEWLNLEENEHRAIIAKEVIALANHGGGYIVIGFRELPDDTFAVASGRPPDLNSWSQSSISGIVAKYVDPSVHCRVVHLAASGAPDKYPIIIVPGGHRVPIRAKAGSPDGKLVANRIYIRRTGPNSEEPRTAEEWDRLFERCLQNRQAELLAAMRSILSGIVPGSASTTVTRLDELRLFRDQAAARWNSRTASLPERSLARLPNGYIDMAFCIDGPLEVPSLSELRRIIPNSVRNHSGWPPFLTVDRAPLSPTLVDGAIETWIAPEPSGGFDRPDHYDFWRVSPRGFLFTRRGWREDSFPKEVTPGKTLSLTSPVWKLGEAVLEASYIAENLKATGNLVCYAKWFGISGRRLSGDGRRMIMSDRTAIQNEFEATETVALTTLPGSLPELIHSMLLSLYELFDFFSLPKRLVEEELAELQRGLY